MMKLRLLALVAGLLTALASQAEASAKISVFGVGTLLDLASSGTGVSDTDKAKFGIGGGAGVQLGSFAVEALYSVRQSQGESGAVLKAPQLQIPFLFRLNPGPMRISLGPYAGLGLGNVTAIAADGTETTTSYGPGFNSFELGATAGVGVNVSMFFVEARYQMAFTNLYSDATVAAFSALGVSDLSSKWKGIQILAGLSF